MPVLLMSMLYLDTELVKNFQGVMIVLLEVWSFVALKGIFNQSNELDGNKFEKNLILNIEEMKIGDLKKEFK